MAVRKNIWGQNGKRVEVGLYGVAVSKDVCVAGTG